MRFTNVKATPAEDATFCTLLTMFALERKVKLTLASSRVVIGELVSVDHGQLMLQPPRGAPEQGIPLNRVTGAEVLS